MNRTYTYEFIDNELHCEIIDSDTGQNLGDFVIRDIDDDKKDIKDFGGGDVKTADVKNALDFWKDQMGLSTKSKR